MLLKVTEGSRGEAMREAEIYRAHTRHVSHPASECNKLVRKGGRTRKSVRHLVSAAEGGGGRRNWREAVWCMQKYAADR